MTSTVSASAAVTSAAPTFTPTVTIDDRPKFSNYTAFCYALFDQGVPTAPDADVSGVGVIVAFVTAAYLTIVVVLVVYFLGLAEPELLNPVDSRVLRIKRRINPPANVRLAITKAVLTLGDQQVVTGVAIMGAGFQGLRTGSISIYHYQIVLYLAWMSSSVHLSALTILGKFMTENPGLLGWRLVGMIVLFVMLLVGLVPTISNDWGISDDVGMTDDLSGWGIPAKCIWVLGNQDGVNPDAIIGYIILIVSYAWKVGALFKRVRTWYNDYLIYPIERVILRMLRWPAQRYAATHKFRYLLLFRVILSITLWIIALMEFAASFAASIWMSVVGIAYGTMQVFEPRWENLVWTEYSESEWGFGQLIALALLVQPIGAIMECIAPGRSGETAEAEVQEAIEDESVPHGSNMVYPQNHTRPFQLDKHVCLLDILSHPHLNIESATSTSTYCLSRATIKNTIYGSVIFKILIWLLQAGILAVAVVALWSDFMTIGLSSAGNWKPTSEAIGGYVGASMLGTFVLCSFSRLGRSRSKGPVWTGQENHVPVYGGDRDEKRGVRVLSYEHDSMI